MSDTSEPKPHGAARATTRVASRPTIRLALPDGWARSVLAALEVVFTGWALVTLASVIAYSSVSANPWMGSANWEGALALGADLWAFALGAPLHVGEVAYTAPPTLLGLLLILLLKVLLRTGADFPAPAQWFAIPAFAAASFVLVGAGASYATWWQCWPGALAIPFIAVVWQVLRQVPSAPDRLALPKWSQRGLRMGLIEVGVVVALGGLVLLGSLADHWEKVSSIHALLLTTNGFQTALVVIAQLLYAPTLIAWALAWLAGPGIYVGVDALHSPSSAPVKPIPGFPVLGALPEGAPGMWIIVVLMGAGGVMGIVLGKRAGRDDLRVQVKEHLVALGLLVAVALAWMTSSQLHLGAERMSLIGPNAIAAAVALGAEVGVSALVASTLVHPEAVKWMNGQWRLSKTPVGQAPQPQVVPVASAAQEPGVEEREADAFTSPEVEAPEALRALSDVDEVATEVLPVEVVEAIEGEPDDETAPAGVEVEADRVRPAVPWIPTPVVVEAVVPSPADQERAEHSRPEVVVDDEYYLETAPRGLKEVAAEDEGKASSH